MAAVAIAVLAACGGADSDRDVVAEAACRDFQSAAADADLLTMEELRERFVDIHDRGQHADDNRIRHASRDLLSAITADDADVFRDALVRMRFACQDHI